MKTYLSISSKIKNILLKAKEEKTKNEYKLLKYSFLKNENILSKIRKDNEKFILTFWEEYDKVQNFMFMKFRDLKEISNKLER